MSIFRFWRVGGQSRIMCSGWECMSRRDFRSRSLVGRHFRKLLSRPGVAGVGAGKGARGEDCLVVLLVDKKLPPGGRGLPRRIKGLPVAVVETGVLRTLGRPDE